MFEPGFSTADKVTELSGRGVGMDVVRRNVEDLHGTVDIESVEGMGTTVELRLPLSLSVIEGFWVEVGGTEYVLPLDEVIECLELPADRRAARRAATGSSICAASRSHASTSVTSSSRGGRRRAARADRRGALPREPRRAWAWTPSAASARRSSSRWGVCFARWPASRDRRCARTAGVAFVIDVARLLRSAARPGAVGSRRRRRDRGLRNI